MKSSSKRWVAYGGLVVICLATALATLRQPMIRNERLEHAEAALFAAVDTNNTNGVLAALQAGASVDARRTSNPRTAWEPLLRLQTRIEYHHYPFQDGYTPLMIASIRGDVPTATLLLARGAKTEVVERPNSDGTPLELAVKYNHPPLVLLLLQHGANPNGVRGSYGPVYDAWLMNRRAITKLLISHGATPLPASMKETPVMRL